MDGGAVTLTVEFLSSSPTMIENVPLSPYRYGNDIRVRRCPSKHFYPGGRGAKRDMIPAKSSFVHSAVVGGDAAKDNPERG